MKGKFILIGGLVYFVVTTVVGMFGTGMVIHEGILKDTYKATSSFWRPELAQDPPDMAALMPQWMTVGFLSALVLAFLYSWVRGSFSGPGWKKGLSFGLFISLFVASLCAAWWGVFNLPGNLWIWWTIDTFIVTCIGCAAMGWATEKWAS